MKVVRLSASRTGRRYPQETFLVLIFTRGRVDPRAMEGRKEYVTEKPSETTGNRSRDRPIELHLIAINITISLCLLSKFVPVKRGTLCSVSEWRLNTGVLISP
jgi:hypothetical protein